MKCKRKRVNFLEIGNRVYTELFTDEILYANIISSLRPRLLKSNEGGKDGS